jgi:signal transduction histidine kinase
MFIETLYTLDDKDVVALNLIKIPIKPNLLSLPQLESCFLETYSLATDGLGIDRFAVFWGKHQLHALFDSALPDGYIEAIQELPPKELGKEAHWHEGDTAQTAASYEVSLLGGGSASYVRLPLKQKGKVYGCMILAGSAPLIWGMAESALARSLVRGVEVALENAELGNEVQLTEALQQSTYNLARIINGELEFSDLLDQILDEVMRLLPISGTEIMLLKNDKTLYLAAQKSLNKIPDFPTLLPVGEGVLGQAVLRRETVFVSDYSTFEYQLPGTEAGDTHSALAVPLICQEEIQGALAVFTLKSEYPEPLDEKSVRVLEVLAPLAAMAIENSRLRDTVRQERSQLQALLDHIRVPIMMFDQRGCLLLANPAAHNVGRRLNLSLYTLIGQSLKEISAQLPEYITMPERFAPGDTTEISFGIAGEFVVRVAELPGKDGNPLGYVVVGQEVTEERRLNRARSELLYVLSHDLGNILSLALGYTSLMLDEPITEEEYPIFMKRIFDALNRARALIRDVVEIEFAETRGIRLAKSYSMIEVMEWVVNALESTAEVKKQKLTLVVDHQPLQELTGNVPLLKQAFENLISNAIKYTPECGSITVRLAADEDHAIIEIKDTGIGIAQKELQNIWERFYRVQSDETRSIQGTGLGLNLVRSVIHSHQGRIEVESAPGTGSLFRVLLPYELNPTHIPVL